MLNLCRWKDQEEALLQEESIAESGGIFVRNLTYTVTEEELSQHFSAIGKYCTTFTVGLLITQKP